MKCVIFDLDRTLSDLRHREHHVTGDKKNWSKFYEGIPHDELNQEIFDLYYFYRDMGYYIVIATAREETLQVREMTFQWLKNHNINPDKIFFRPEKDYRPDYEVKEIVAKLTTSVFESVIAFDDNDEVLKMYQKYGILTFRVDLPEKTKN